MCFLSWLFVLKSYWIEETGATLFLGYGQKMAICAYPNFCYCTCMWYLIKFPILSQSVSIFHVSWSFIYYLNIWNGLLFFQLNKELVNKKVLVIETSLDFMYILLYYFSLIHVIYNFYLTKINLSTYFYSISEPSSW